MKGTDEANPFKDRAHLRDAFRDGERSIRKFLNDRLDFVEAPKAIPAVNGSPNDNERLWMRITSWVNKCEMRMATHAAESFEKINGGLTKGRAYEDALSDALNDQGPQGDTTLRDEVAELIEDMTKPDPNAGMSFQRLLRKKMLAEKPMSDDQKKAWKKLRKWLAQDEDPYFVLKGYAGTGKTYLLSLLATLEDYNFIFSAPTNKASKVLSAMMGGAQAKTIYSVLGIRMKANEDSQELDYPKSYPAFSKNTIIVIDEAGMVNKQLFQYIDTVRDFRQIKILYVGDPAQLNPVKESRSPSWDATEVPEHRALLKEVKRFDNELLTLSIDLRKAQKEKDWTFMIEKTDAKKGSDEGVFLLGYNRMMDHLLDKANSDKYRNTKVICWRNKKVDEYNRRIREAMGFTKEYEVGDSLLLAQPVVVDDQMVGTIDEEGLVIEVNKTTEHVMYGAEFDKEVDIGVWSIDLDTGGAILTLKVPREDSVLASVLSNMAGLAHKAKGLQRKYAWDNFWAIKNRFHDVRYAYALTTHRAQGSTYEVVYVDQQDILANQNKREAYRSFYVAATRPTKALYTY